VRLPPRRQHARAASTAPIPHRPALPRFQLDRSNRGLRRLLLAFGPALVAIVVGALAVDGARRTRDVSDWVERSHVVVETAGHLLSRMVDAETAQRGYVITGDERYLAPAVGADRDVGRALDSLSAMTRGHTVEEAQLAAVRARVMETFAAIGESIRLRRTAGEAAAVAVITTGGGKAAMDDLRGRLAALIAEERRLLAVRRADEQAHSRATVIVVVAGTLLAALLALLANLTLVAAAAAESRTTRELAGANERMHEQAGELEQQNETLLEQRAELEAQQTQLAEQAAELARQSAEVRSLNTALEAQLRDLAALNAGLESFSYTVSHDLRTPLGAINGMCTLLEEDYSERLDDEGRRMLGRVRANAMHMGELIDGLLELARVSRGELKLELVDVSAIAREIGGGLARQAAERVVRFDVEDGITVCADRRLVSALVQNLLTNAWKFSAKVAEPAIEVRRWAEGPPDTFLVRDNGAGFDMAYAAKLFAAFQRLHAKEFEGTGIGLATVDRVARRHGGAVWAEGAVGKGATFFVTLPGETCQPT
jgi:signal transduction histidine kinase